jgi:ABC-type dipeptide/oligopeptide/nickel transport system permease component
VRRGARVTRSAMLEVPSVFLLSAVFVLVNLLTDVAYAKADPRVRYD